MGARIRALVYERQGKRLINNIDLDISPDSITVVMGANGTGKTLLLRLLHGMIRPTSGQITWNGEMLNEGVRKRQAMVFQQPILLRRSVAENIGYVVALRKNRGNSDCRQLLDYVGLSDRATQAARLLSAGEQQRLALARALALEPNVLFLDEPTANLDPGSTDWIESIVKTVSRAGTKIIYVTHDIGQARRLADDIVFLEQGRIAEHVPAKRFFDFPESNAAKAYLEGRLTY